MKRFKHKNAISTIKAISILRKSKAQVIAGGTDLLGILKDEVLPKYPETIVNIKTIPGLDYISVERDVLKIGSLTRLSDISQNVLIKEKYASLGEAARRVSSPQVREMGTIGGNICQFPRCWYFRLPNNRFFCLRKGGRDCPALTGEGRYHSIFGGIKVNGVPCSTDCPANEDIPSYMDALRSGDMAEAAKILLDSNPLPAITGRICPHYCEGECNREKFDEPISIRSIERYIGDYILENAGKMYKSPQRETKKRVAIVGSGPAGLSAAYYLRRLGHSVTVFEAMEEPGGMLTYGIPPFRLPKDVIRKQIKALEGTGIQFKPKVNVGKDVTLEGLWKDFSAVFCAIGAWKERQSGIRGEQFLMSGMEFLRSVNNGVREVSGREVAVIGGGNVAMDVARTLARLGAEPLIIYRRDRGAMPALKEEVDRAEQEGAKMQFLTTPIEALKKDGKIVLKCTRMKLGPLDKTGRPHPIPIEGSEFNTTFDLVIEALGEDPDLSIMPEELLEGIEKLKFNPYTYYIGGNVFGGGDFIKGSSTVVEAITAGRNAASRIDQYLKKKIPSVVDNKKANSIAKFNSDYIKKTRRVETPELLISQRKIDTEDVMGLTLRAVETEANRCFNCSCIAVNVSDIAPVLIALNAKIKTTKRIIYAEKFFTVKGYKTTVLDTDEILTEIQIPAPTESTCSAFIKFALRKSIDFPIVNCAVVINKKTARICLNGVFNTPYRATASEKAIIGKPINETNAEAAADAAVIGTLALPTNKYVIQIARVLVKRAILACKG